MRLGIVGGRLQGTEAAYLAGEAGYEVVVVDRCADVPAAGLADERHAFDVTADPLRARRVLGRCDAVLPACENAGTIAWLAQHVPEWGVPLLFDPPSYEITSSKLTSDRLFSELGVPRPASWPDSGFPVVVKPDGASGSHGVQVVRDARSLARARRLLEAAGHAVVVQEFVAGPSLSLEVLVRDGQVTTLLPTLLEFDRGWDCKRVVAPADADPVVIAALRDITRRLAEGICLRGLMDVEVMVDGSVPKVIEIDARLPSQTPTAVYHSCGANMVALLCGAHGAGSTRRGEEGRREVARRPRRAVVYQHVVVGAGSVEVVGEHALAGARPLRREPGFFGATQALTDYAPGVDKWAATLIVEDADTPAARSGAAAVLEEIARRLGLRVVPESGRTFDSGHVAPSWN